MHHARPDPMSQHLATEAVQGILALPISFCSIGASYGTTIIITILTSRDATEALRPGPSDGLDGHLQ